MHLYKLQKKVKCTLVQALRLCTDRAAHKGSRGIALLFLGHSTRRGWGISVTPRALFTTGKKTGIHCTGGWVGRSGRVQKISPPPGFDPRTVQSVASRYTDWATGPDLHAVHIHNLYTEQRYAAEKPTWFCRSVVIRRDTEGKKLFRIEAMCVWGNNEARSRSHCCCE